MSHELPHYSTEEEASRDLDTKGFAWRWRVAKEKHAPDWNKVRLYFLESGGRYKERYTWAYTH
ncbi:hypothetical protein [Telluribacter humicola]|uniref:hypothetical protein n=1 Tax=Telluribacter humicola TaxID=1720261 RepID=UPI001A958362|nr:hypothetical protein [Telluribacter humicola]